jgi:hypothetical protein
MQQALADFRIESDRVVYLAFADGRSYRVSPGDLDRFLKEEDLHRVRRALRVRRQFMRRILPPTALILVVAGIIGVGRYDMYQVSQTWLAPAPAAQQHQIQKAVAPVPTSPAPVSKPASSGVPTQTSSFNAPMAGPTTKPQPLTTSVSLSKAPVASSQVSKGSETKSAGFSLQHLTAPLAAPLATPLLKGLGL